MVDHILAQRAGSLCEKVTLVAHSTATNSALVAASDPTLNLQGRVGHILSIAPCLIINSNTFWLPVRDPPSIAAFYGSLSDFGITNLFGPLS